MAFAAFLALGLAVHRFGEPAPLWAFDRALVGRGTQTAWWITQAGRASVLVPVAVALVIAAIAARQWRGRIVFSLVLLVVAWRAADFFQHVFARPRRADWLVVHETSFSYPSSHAAIATAFFALWAWLLARHRNAGARLGSAALTVLAVAILWSRLALGAHYVTDVAGGVLLGAAVLFGGVAVWPEIAVAGRREDV